MCVCVFAYVNCIAVRYAAKGGFILTHIPIAIWNSLSLSLLALHLPFRVPLFVSVAPFALDIHR